MRRCNHGDGSEVHTVVLTDAVLPPITFSYSLKAAAAMFADAATTLRSLPQNTTTQKERNHAILGTGEGDTDRRLPAVAAGQYDVLRDMQSGEGAKP